MSAETSPPSYSSVKPERYLSGFLNKLSQKGLIKNWKKRWVVFNESSCQLRCFNTPQDLEPIEAVSIRDAVFSFDSSKERPNVFKISSCGLEHFFEASSDEVCFNWLLFLQRSRRSYSLKRTENLEANSVSSDLQHPDSGLLGEPSELSPDSIDLLTFDESPSEKPKLKHSYSYVKKQVLSALKNRSSFQLSDLGFSSSRPGSMLSTDSSLSDKKADESIQSECSSGKKSPRKQSFRRKFTFSKENSAEDDEFSRQKFNCQRCIALQGDVEQLKQQKENVEEELIAGQEVIRVLQQHVSTAAAQKDTANNLLDLRHGKGTEDLLRDRDNKIVDLQTYISEYKLQISSLKEQQSALETNIENYMEQVSMLKDLLSAKDEAVMSLTNRIFDLEEKIGDCNELDANKQKTVDKCVNCIQMLDQVQAYQFQNKFLNSEIVELHKLIEDANEREEKLVTSSSNWEAKFCQVQSKYLLLLKDLHAPKTDNNESENLVSQLVQDALEEDAKNQATSLSSPPNSKSSTYDQLGFNKAWGIEDDVFAQKVQHLNARSKCLSENLQTAESEQWMSKWDNFMQILGNKELQKSLDVKMLVRCGIPHKYRGAMWKRFIDLRVKNIRNRYKTNYYHSLLASHTNVSKSDPFVKQIELDLLRTLPNNKHYETHHSDGICRLRRVLLAYSWHNPSVGYCQGINRLVAIALLYLDEEDAFWCLVAIIEKIMPVDYYSKTLITSQVDQRVLKDLMQEKVPRLYAHLEAHNVDLSLVTFTWLLTVYVDNIPVKTYLNIWDSFLYEGCKVLFRYALAIFKKTEDELLKLKDYMSINMYLRGFAQSLDDIKTLRHIAFYGLQSFSIKSIATKRTHHMQIVRKELDALEAMRAELPDDKDDSCSDCD